MLLLAVWGLFVSLVWASPSPKAPTDNPWFSAAQDALAASLKVKDNNNRAKNAVIFLGDGMGVNSVTGIRLLLGGESAVLAWEEFPNTGLVKTYNSNQQVPDSAGTISAIMTGVKTRAGVININGSVLKADCAGSLGQELPTLAEYARAKGMGIGIVTTARVTHATPAGMFGHAADRGWESSAPAPCLDLAQQLVAWNVNNVSWDVVLGGGRAAFNQRGDGQDLLAKWISTHGAGHYVSDADELAAALNGTATLPLFGLFNDDHMRYHVDCVDDPACAEPTLDVMAAAAIELLSSKYAREGYLLLVEGAKIDMGHHDGNAARALSEGVELHKAVARVAKLVDSEDTLLVVTADHAHTTTLAGYPTLGNPVLGVVYGNDNSGEPKSTPELALDGLPYTSFGYANGPGAVAGGRPEPVDTTDKNYRQQSLVPLSSETHGGQDVGIWASGPRAHFVRGTVEQNYVFFLVSHALELLDGTPSSSASTSELKDGPLAGLIIGVLVATALVAAVIVTAVRSLQRSRASVGERKPMLKGHSAV